MLGLFTRSFFPDIISVTLLLLSVTLVPSNELNGSSTIDVNTHVATALSSSPAFNITFYLEGFGFFLTFNHTRFVSGQIGSFPTGTYNAQVDVGIVGGDPCHAEIVFSHWNWTGGLSVNDPNNRTTNVTITGNGTLTAVYQNVSLCTPLSPLSIFTALFAGLMLASLLRTNRRRDPVKSNKL